MGPIGRGELGDQLRWLRVSTAPSPRNVVTARPLLDIFALVRCEDDSQKFLIELMDNVCCVKMAQTDRGHRTGPIRKPVPAACEDTLLEVMGEYDTRGD
eukprot:gene7543-51328_t